MKSEYNDHNYNGKSEQEQKEREREAAWLKENSDVFWAAAITAYESSGRGAIVVDARAWPSGGEVPKEMMFGYFPQAYLEQRNDEIVKRVVREYDPTWEFVLVLLKPEERVSTYRLQMLPRQSEN